MERRWPMVGGLNVGTGFVIADILQHIAELRRSEKGANAVSPQI